MKERFALLWFSLILFTLLFQPLNAQEKRKEVFPMQLTITSSAFKQDGMIPSQYSCDGRDVSPPLSWSEGPAGTQSYALITDDPDAPMGTWVHWVMYNIPKEVSELVEEVPTVEKLKNNALQGKNDFGRYGYGGPCPPGGTHRYYFKIYALDTMIQSGPGLTKKQLLKAMEGHILAQGELMGKYSR